MLDYCIPNNVLCTILMRCYFLKYTVKFQLGYIIIHTSISAVQNGDHVCENARVLQHSLELMVFVDNRPTIRTGILSSVQHDIAHEAFARHLISKEVHRTVTDPSNRWTADERTDKFMEDLESGIRNDGMVLIKFIDMLRELDAAYYAPLIKTISKTVIIIEVTRVVKITT